MSDYRLYGEKMIQNDDTMKSFAESIVSMIDDSDLKKLEKAYHEEDDNTEYEDVFMERVHDFIHDDIPRTDIDYPELMWKYSSEIGSLLYNMENHGFDISNIKISFFGEAVKETFNILIEEMVWFVKFYNA